MSAKRPAEARREETPGGSNSERSQPRRQPTATTWTEADAAELDVLVHALVFDFWEHREQCEACRPEPCQRYAAWLEHKAGCRICEGLAPLTFGWDCPERRRFLDEHHDCSALSAVPGSEAAISEVVDWREARMLLSSAEYLRELQDAAA